MTDTLRDLLRESVADAEMPEVAETAWAGARRARRRRTTGAVAGVAAVAVVVGGVVWLADRGTDSPRLAPSHSPTTPTTAPASPYAARSAPDAHYAGVPVWWSPTLAQEANLPPLPNDPLPGTVDVSQAMAAPVTRAPGVSVAAFGVLDADGGLRAVEVLDAEGRLDRVDTSRVRPMTAPDGSREYRLGPSLLSREGDYLLFPQDHEVLLYALRTGEWRTVHTGDAPTWDAMWVTPNAFVVGNPSRPLSAAPLYTVDGTTDSSANDYSFGLPSFYGRRTFPAGSSELYGRSRTGHRDIAQAFGPGVPIPAPRGMRTGVSDWIAVTGSRPAVLLVPAEPGRARTCCQVDGWVAPDVVMYDSTSTQGTRVLAWQARTGRFWRVTQLAGAPAGGSVTGSYAQFAAARSPTPPPA